MQEKPPFSLYLDFFSNVWKGVSPSHALPLRTFNLPSGTPLNVIVTLHVHHKVQQINTRYKILQKDVTMYL